jgi:hypothetical protein
MFYDQHILILTGEVSAPSRSVTATIEAKRKDPGYTGLIDVKWDAILDKSKQLFVDLVCWFPVDIKVCFVLLCI